MTVAPSGAATGDAATFGGWARSALFAPATDQRKVGGALAGPADLVIVDLEDSVRAADKPRARVAAVEALSNRSRTTTQLVALRVNDLTTPWFPDDIDAAHAAGVDVIVLPKADAWSVAGLDPSGPPVMAIIETAEGLRTVHQVATHQRVCRILLGGADLSNELGLEVRADGLELLFARSQVVVASSAAGISAPIDVAHLEIRDEAALRDECALAKSLGMSGKMCIHPAQASIVNDAFTPSSDEVAFAREIVDAFEAAEASGAGVTVVRGRMVDKPVVSRAQRTLARASR